MKPGNLAVLAPLLMGGSFGALGATSLVLAGCEVEGEARDPAVPEAIGYTPPSVASTGPAAAPPLQQQQPQQPPGAEGPSDGLPAEDAYADADPAALTDFRGTLEPYGTWTEDPTYGTVWVPSESVVGQDFTPYVSDGHWAYDDDYLWVSDYEWGWAPFHYGRWAYADGPGWEWVPGRQYAGAWVSWRTGNEGWGYVGWAPLPPTWGWRGGAAVGLGFVPRAPYAFVGTGSLFAPSVGGRLVAGPQVGVVAAHSAAYVPTANVSGPASGSSGHVIAHPSVGGPTPDSIHIAASAVVHVAPNEARGVAQARAYARPSTAVALGARAPAGSPVQANGGYATRAATPYSSHFGGRLGGGFAGNAAGARPMPAPYYGERGGFAASHPYYGSSSVSRGYAAPRSVSSSPSGYGGHSAGGSTFHGGAAPSSSFHGGGGGGGFHGGGGGGGGHGGHR